MTEFKIIGKSYPRFDGPVKASGETEFLADIDIEGCWIGGVVRSTVARGKLLSVTASEGFDALGAVLVTAADIPGENFVAIVRTDYPALADGYVNYVSQAIALVAAPDAAALQAAMALVQVEIEPLPPIFTIEDSLAKKEIIWGEDNVIDEYRTERGDIAAGFAAADVVVEGEWRTGLHEQMYLETQGMSAVSRADGSVEVLGSMQCPFYVHGAVQKVLGLRAEQVIVRQSATGGAFGAYMFGIGSTEMLGVVVTGEIWLRVPHTLQMHWDGHLGAGVTAKDMMLHMVGRFGMNGGQYQAVEFMGDAVTALSMQERMTLSNMSAELGAQVGLIAPDETTREWLLGTGVPPDALQGLEAWRTDDGAALTRYDFDATTLAPQVAAPHSPANAGPVGHHAGTAIDVAYIGACTGAKLDDLRAAATVLRGQRVASGVRLMVAPASQHDQSAARAEGVLQVLQDAGAELFPTTCGACAGYGDTVGDHTTVISSTARNFKGRMGSATAQVYLASPYTVAASALRGRITDPREVLP